MKKIVSQIIFAFLPPIFVYIFQYFAEVFFAMYQRYPNFDIPMHFLGGLSMAITGFYLIKIAENYQWIRITNKLLCIFIIVCFVAFVATLWEFHEFLMDFYLGTHMQVNEADTMLDMFLGVFGALVSGGILVYKKGT